MLYPLKETHDQGLIFSNLLQQTLPLEPLLLRVAELSLNVGDVMCVENVLIDLPTDGMKDDGVLLNIQPLCLRQQLVHLVNVDCGRVKLALQLLDERLL